MTDTNKDIIEEAKKLANTFVGSNAKDVVNKLISEVGRLRVPNDWNPGTSYRQLKYRIESLTKELDEYKLGVSVTGDALVQKNLKLEAENAELKKRIAAGKRIFEEIKEICTHG